MRKLLKMVVVAVIVAEWYTRGGKEFLFGPEVDQVERDGMMWIRDSTRVSPPTFHSTYPPSAAELAVGMVIEYHGEVIGEITSAVVEERAIIVGYSVEREKLGWPITVAVSQAVQAVAETVAPLAISTE